MSIRFVNGPSWSDAIEISLSYRPYVIMIVAIALLSTAGGAFNTDHLSILHRFTLWLVVGSLIVIQSHILDGFMEAYLKGITRQWWISSALALFAVTLMMTLELHGLKYTPLLPKKPDPFLDFFVFLCAPVMSIAGAVIYFRRQLHASGQQTKKGVRTIWAENDREVADEGAEIAFSSWPSETILYLKACDHYLDITTETGHSFIKGRMADAVHLLAKLDGAHVHRSWWVSKPYIRRIFREGRDWVIETHGGENIPIARSRVKGLQKKGWNFDT